MLYFILPEINNSLDLTNIKIKRGENDIIISKSLSNYLNDLKTQINNYKENWDFFKKYTNTYEYIHTNIPYTKLDVCKYKPLSRAFYKLIEIYQSLNLLNDTEKSINSFHLAEGPGGFIEAIEYMRKNNNDKYYGMTLIDNNNDNVPGWNKGKYFLSKHKNIIIENGIDKTGNLFSIDNLWHCYHKYNNTMDLITGDGGFDFSNDFNKQEILCINLVFCQICYAIAIQKKGGSFVLKIFDIFSEVTIDIIYLLSLVYKEVYITKPNTSRTANSEKYIICKNFKIDERLNIIKHLASILKDINNNSNPIKRFLNIDIPYYYINKIEDINAVFGQQQLENIISTLYLLDNNKNEKIEILKKNNIQKCIQWCNKYKLPYNHTSYINNLFLPN